LKKGFEAGKAARVAALFDGPLHAAELETCLTTGFDWGEIATQIFSRLHFQMELQFFVEVLVHPATEEEFA
jgi:hypothetical protein